MCEKCILHQISGSRHSLRHPTASNGIQPRSEAEIYAKEIHPLRHANRGLELSTAADGLFGKVSDTIREAALMAAGRKLGAEALAETCRAGLKEIFR